jgi:PTS system nitrogen regulatory IIA component
MELSQLLRPQAVKVLGSVTSKKRLFQELGEIASTLFDLIPEAAVNALQDRESLGPTGVGHGVALPHARLPGIEKMAGAFIRLERPMDFEAVDRQPVDLVFALFAPEEAGVQHLKALALVSRTMRDPGVCAKLRANADPVTLHAVLTEGPRTRAA